MFARVLKITWSFFKSHKILAAILLLYGSAIFIAALGKILRVHFIKKHHDIAFLEYLDLFRPEVFGGLGLIFLILSITTVSSRLVIPFIISYVLWAAVCFFEIIGALYYAVTLDPNLDISVIIYSVANLEELLPVLTHTNVVLKKVAVVAPIVILSAVLISLYLKIKGEIKCPWISANKWAFISLPIAAVVCLIISTLPNQSLDDRGLTQTFTYNILSSIADIGEASSLADGTDAEKRFPIAASVNKIRDSQTRNFVFIILESTGWAATSMGSPELATTPYMLSIASQSELYSNTYTVVPHTSKSLQGILCGIDPPISHWMTEAGKAGIPTNCLAEMLASHGYRTAFFQTATAEFERRAGLVSNMGYADFFPLEAIPNQDNYEVVNYLGLEDDAILPVNEEWLSQVGQAPFFATYLTLTPHHPYNSPDRYGKYDFSESEEKNKYLNAVYYQDHFIKKLIDQFKEFDLYENTVFVMVGDHGEAFGEHDLLQHDLTIYNEGIHVPLMIHDPQNTQPKLLSDTISTLDIIPTLLDKYGWQLAREEQLGYIYGEREGASVITHCHRAKTCMSIIKDGYKMVHHFGIKGDELFRLSDDQGEENNIADGHQELAQELLAEMIAWRMDLLIQYRAFLVGS